jgi:hypothetical protein
MGVHAEASFVAEGGEVVDDVAGAGAGAGHNNRSWA